MTYSELKTAVLKKLTDNYSSLGVNVNNIVFGDESTSTPAIHVMMYPFETDFGNGFLSCNIEVYIEGEGHYSDSTAMDNVISLSQKVKNLLIQVGSTKFKSIKPVINVNDKYEIIYTDNVTFCLTFNSFVEW